VESHPEVRANAKGVALSLCISQSRSSGLKGSGHAGGVTSTGYIPCCNSRSHYTLASYPRQPLSMFVACPSLLLAATICAALTPDVVLRFSIQASPSMAAFKHPSSRPVKRPGGDLTISISLTRSDRPWNRPRHRTAASLPLTRPGLHWINGWVLLCKHVLHTSAHPILRFGMGKDIQLLVLDRPENAFGNLVG
jgi:hypothetical protein